LASLPAGLPATSAEALDLLAGVLFVPLVASPESRRRSAALAAALADDLPALVARAGDPHGVGEALRHVMDRHIDAMERSLRAAGIDDRRVVDGVIVGCYLTGLIATLDRDTLDPPRGGHQRPPVVAAVPACGRGTSRPRLPDRRPVRVHGDGLRRARRPLRSDRHPGRAG
jgi:hypothetical protein